MYEVFLIVSLAIPSVLFSTFFIILFKWPQKIISTNKKIEAIKIEDFVEPINKSITSVLKNNLYENSSLQKSLTDIHLLLEKMNSALTREDEKEVKNNEVEIEDITSVLKNNLYENSSLQKSLTDIHLLLEKMNSALTREDEKEVKNNEVEIEDITSVLKNNLYENSSLQKSLTDIHLLLEKMNSALTREDEKEVKNNEVEIEDITSVLKNNLYENSSLQKSLTDIHLLLEKMNSALTREDEKEVDDYNDDQKDKNIKVKSLSKSSPSFSSEIFTTIDLPKTKTEKPMIFKEDRKTIHQNTKDIDEIVNSTYENNSIVELRSLEMEILNALKRLEKTGSNTNPEN